MCNVWFAGFTTKFLGDCMGFRFQLQYRLAAVALCSFLTCDLMSSMSAEAEGIQSCYFSTVPKQTFYIEYDDTKLFLDFVLANAVIFGKIGIELLAKDPSLRFILPRGDVGRQNNFTVVF